MRTYRTGDNDMLDHICWHEYGRTSGVLEKVIEANPGIENHPGVLPPGMVIVLPELASSPPVRGGERLWD